MAEKGRIDPFNPSQKVWLLDNRPTEVDQIRGSLNPEIVTFDKYDNLIESISDRLNTSEDAYGTLIISQHIPGDIAENMVMFSEAMNNEYIVNRVYVFQITDKGVSPFNNSKVYSTVHSFLDDAANIHLERITNNADIGEQAQQVIRQLKVSKNQYQSRYEQAVKEHEETKAELESTSSALTQLKAKIAYYEQQISEADEKSNRADQIVSDNEQKINNLITGLDQARAQAARDSDKIIELNARIEGQDKTIVDISSRNNQLQLQIQDMQTQYDDLQETNRKLLQARTDAERIGEVQNQLEIARNQTKDMRKTIDELKQDLVIKDNEITGLQQTNKAIREGHRDYSQLGYSNVFQNIELSSTDAMYFKVIDPLPYHRFYINRIASVMKKLVPESVHVVVVMMKIDQGNDRARFKDYTVIGDLGAINEDHDKYYLIPSKRMGENVKYFEQQDTVLIFIDYIDNEKYYLETHGTIDYYYVIKNSRLAQTVYSNLKGLPISYDHRSKMDIKYRPRLTSMTSQNQEEHFDSTVQGLMESSNVVQDNLNNQE